jgi:hypothetical protein
MVSRRRVGAVPEFDIYLRFDSPEDRDPVLGHLRTLVPDGELIEQGDTVFRRVHADEENAAHISTQMRVREACTRANVDHDRVHLKPGGWGPGS